MAQLDIEIAALKDEVAAEATVEQSAVALLNGIPALVQKAVDAALAAGATPDQLQALSDLKATMQSNIAPLSAAVVANTPAAPAPAPAPAPDPAPAP